MPSAPNSRAWRASAGVSAFARTPSVRSPSAPSEHGCEARVDRRADERDVVGRDGAGRAVDGDEVALAQHALADADLASVEVDVERGHARDRGAAHAARHERGVRGLAALGGEDAARGVEAGDVVGLGERAHEDDVRPSAAAATASSAVNTIWPLAAPGEAATPRASTS